ncbi:UNVERIFIED_CONTAM: STAS domain-containing protein, partial [Prevotella sp. 15_C9]
RLDTANARDFSIAIQPLLQEDKPNIIVNCEQMSYISSSGLRCFLILQKSVQKNQGSLIIEAMRPEIKNIFEMTGCTS